MRLRVGEGLVGEVAQRREGMLVNDYQNSPYAYGVFKDRLGQTAAIGEPLFYHGRLIGVICVT